MKYGLESQFSKDARHIVAIAISQAIVKLQSKMDYNRERCITALFSL